jgi:hypothetical protein
LSTDEILQLEVKAQDEGEKHKKELSINILPYETSG